MTDSDSMRSKVCPSLCVESRIMFGGKPAGNLQTHFIRQGDGGVVIWGLGHLTVTA